MRQLPIIIAHYTIDTGYEEEVKKLLCSLERLQLEHEVVPIRSLGTWRANSNYSVQLIEEALKKYPTRSILKTDADAIFCERPVLFEQDNFDYDFAACWQDFKYRKNELLGGTLYFANTEPAKELVQRWKVKVEHGPTQRNPELLHAAIQEMGSNLRWNNIPPEYCKIFDIMRRVRHPVIEHFQASRRFKTQVNIQGRTRS